MAWKPDYATLAEGKAFIRVGDAVDDAEVAIWITAGSRLIDDRCNRQFGLEVAPVARTYRRPPTLNRETGLWELEIDDLQTTTGLTVNGVAYASSGAVLLPDNAPLEGKPWTRIGQTTWPIMSYPGLPVSNVLVGQWGWTTVPAGTKSAIRLQLNRWGSRRDSPYGIAGSPDTGGELRLLSRLDPDVVTSLRGLTRRRRAG